MKTLPLALLAAATLPALAESSTNLYGSIAFHAGASDSNGKGENVIWDGNTLKARFGIRGREDFGGGLTTLYQFEFGSHENGRQSGISETRYAWLGIQGNFGMLSLGKQQPLNQLYLRKTDIFNSFAFADPGQGKTIRYTSPDFSGLIIAVEGVLDGKHEVVPTATNKHFAQYAGVLHYRNGNVEAGFVYLKQSGSGEVWPRPPAGGNTTSKERIGGSLALHNEHLRVATDIEHVASSSNGFRLSGEYFHKQHTFKARAGFVDYFDGIENSRGYGLGYQYNFSPRTYAWVEGQRQEQGDYRDWAVTTGIRHDF